MRTNRYAKSTDERASLPAPFYTLSSASGRWRWLVAVLACLLLPSVARAQFFRINIIIPPATEQLVIQPFDLQQRGSVQQGMEILDGNAVVSISGTENFQLQVRLEHADSLRNATGHSLPMVSSLAYRNDGQSEPPGVSADDTATFPLSNSGRLIRYMNDFPATLQAYLFLSVKAAIPLITTSPFTGEVHLIIEYN